MDYQWQDGCYTFGADDEGVYRLASDREGHRWREYIHDNGSAITIEDVEPAASKELRRLALRERELVADAGHLNWLLANNRGNLAAEREATVRYLDAAADLWQPVPRAALREASEAIRLGAHLTRTVSATIPHYATLQEAHGPEDAGMTKPETVAFLEAERQRLAEEVRGLRAGMFDLQLAVGGSSCLDAVRGATTAEREAIAAFIERSYSHGDHVGDLAARLRAGAHHATLQEAQGPDSATPSASADSCDKNGGTDSSPETSG